MYNIKIKKQLLNGLFVCTLLLILQFTAYGQQGVIQGDWNTRADSYRGRNGERFTFQFPAGGTISSRVWGTDIYTDDGSIATAAVHYGLITAADGGTVTIEIKPGAASYTGSTRYGVTSRDYGAFSGSFVFISGKKNAPSGNIIQADWNTRADSYRGRNGERFTFQFPAGGTISSRVWGTDIYTDDGSIATAAVHYGLITAADGGTVTIEIKPGAASYTGSTRYGVTSRDYGAFSGSFVFISGKKNAPSGNIIQGDWNTRADSYRGRNGERFTFQFPAGGTISSRVWGTDLYTDDGSIATAAVHYGLITTADGGTVTIEIKPGAASYTGSTRYGVTSRDYGAFTGSFVFIK
jgi:uncharacterized protein (UPF0303 family)